VNRATETLLRSAADRALAYLDNLNTRHVGVTAADRQRLEYLRRPLPLAPESPESTLRALDDLGSPATTATAGGRFFGFVNGGTLPVALAATWLATAWDQDAGMAALCPVNAVLEEIALAWMIDLFGLPRGCGGAFVTGATMANFTALAAARNSTLARLGWNVEQDGLFGAPPVTVVVSDEVHVSVIKALGLLGFGRTRVVRLPVDNQGRIVATSLPSLPEAAIVCVQVGNVNTGASDPVAPICDWAHGHGAWVHVDGGFGMWAAASERLRPLVAGLGAADSWATDGHKWLNVPYDSGIAFVRDESALRAAMGTSAAYLEKTETREPDQYTPELSRRARGVEIWAALRTLGRQGVADLVERTCRHAATFATGLRDAGYEVLNEVCLNQVLVSFGTPEQTRRVIATIQEEGTCWCGGTVWQGRTAMRISVSSWATTDEDVARSLEAMIRITRSGSA
jgi:glutamate/tyrosine decarboxylase-like PLP-dependent enzyme